MGGGGKGGKAELPTVKYDTGGLYGSGSAGAKNTFNPTDFQSNLVKTTQSAIPQYLQNLINPSYDSDMFKASQQNLSNMARQSMENDVINPLAQRGLARGSNTMAMSDTLNKNLIDANYGLMQSENQRVNDVLGSLFNAYQMPYNMMQGINSNAQNILGSQMQAQAQKDASNSAMFGGIANGVGSLTGAALMASDVRLKENLELLDNVNDVNIYKFDYINGDKGQIGVIAQEVLPTYPDAVIDGEYYKVDYSKLPEVVQKRIDELRK